LTITIYGIKNCDTMAKARAWLDSKGVKYKFHDYKETGIDRAHLEQWVQDVGWETLLNRAGTTFRKLPDAQKTGLNESKSISLMMAQLSENADLFNVFTDMFHPEGSEIYLKPVSDYVTLGEPVNFYTVVEAAKRRGETAIGYRLETEAGAADKSYGVHTNPKKSDQVVFTSADKVIVIAEE